MKFTVIKPVAIVLIFLAVGSVIYSNTLDVPFYFDDILRIKENPYIRLTDLTLKNTLNASFNKVTSRKRPVGSLSFALNYYFHQYKLRGYHIVNIIIHLLSGIFLYFVINTTLGIPRLKSTYHHTETIALCAALIWLVHPLHTQSVTYIVQRFNSMAAMFFILSLWLYAKGRLVTVNRKNWPWYAGSVFAGILALGSKENAAMLPLFILLYEWYFFQDLDKNWLKRYSKYILGIVILCCAIAFFYLGTSPIEKLKSLNDFAHNEFTLSERIWTQFRVVIYYLSLLAYPHPSRLNLDYDFPLSHSLVDPISTLLCFGVVIGLLGLAVYFAKKERLLSFCILWYFGNLIIESSVIPLAIIYEHRTYLPSMFICLLAVALSYRFIKVKWIGIALTCIVVTVFSYWTYQRNSVWGDPVAFWSDCVHKSPQKARPHNNLGQVLADQGRLDEAEKQYTDALKINPDFADAHNNLGIVLKTQGKISEAINQYDEALRINPNFVKAHNNLGNALIIQQGVTDEAISHFKEALRLNPKFVEAYNSLSIAMINAGKIDEAIVLLRKAIEIYPNLAATYVNLGGALMLQNKSDEALVCFKKALQLKPDIAQAHVNLGIILYNKERLDEAIAHFRKALSIDPGNEDAQFNLNKALAFLKEINTNIESVQKNLAHKPEEPILYLQLGNLYNSKGELDKAMAQYQKAISFQPDFPEALYHLAKLHIKKREFINALALYQKVITLLPENPGVYYNVACIYARQNKPEESVGWLKKAVEKGFNDWNHIKTDSDLDNIRTSSLYKEFVNGH
jgi:protein O-mannosyl-transferase